MAVFLARSPRGPNVVVLGAAYALFSFLGGTVFQMEVRGTEPTARGALHPLVTTVMVVFILLSIAFGAFLHGTRFRLYSIGTLLTVIVFVADQRHRQCAAR